jgi:RNA recognition motif-containing protein
MSSVEESQRALDAMQDFELNGRKMQVERARRSAGYDKTPGVCKYSLFHASYQCVDATFMNFCRYGPSQTECEVQRSQPQSRKRS